MDMIKDILMQGKYYTFFKSLMIISSSPMIHTKYFFLECCIHMILPL